MNAKQICNGERCGTINYRWDCLGWANDFTVELFHILKPVYGKRSHPPSAPSQRSCKGLCTSATRVRKKEGQPLRKSGRLLSFLSVLRYIASNPNSQPEPAATPSQTMGHAVRGRQCWASAPPSTPQLCLHWGWACITEKQWSVPYSLSISQCLRLALVYSWQWKFPEITKG